MIYICFPGKKLFNPDLSCSKADEFCRPGEGLTSVPTEQIPTNTTSVNLKNNSIQILDNNSFSGLTDITELSLSNNDISDIAPGTFHDQGRLTYLDLGYNNLSTINGSMWEGLDNVTTLRLTGNDLTTIRHPGFPHLSSLSTIVVDYPTLKRHKRQLLHPLTYPDLKPRPHVAHSQSSRMWVNLAVEGNLLPCDESSCWLKRLEEKGFDPHYYNENGTWCRPKCFNSNKYWDEVDLNCEL